MKKLILSLAFILLFTGCNTNLGANDFEAKVKNSKFKDYTVTNSSLTKITGGEKNKRQVTIEKDLFNNPSVTVNRWDEVSFKIKHTPKKTLLGSMFGASDSVDVVGDKIIYSSVNEDTVVSEVPISEEHPEGGINFDTILKEKPATNVVEYQIETTGLDFFYQAGLNEEALDLEEVSADETHTYDKYGNIRATRPENIVGSYAIYTSENKMNFVGGKDYKAGKVGHIYRPKIIDANGNWVWGEFNRDVQTTGILSVTISQDFLDKAVYPVIVDPTLGNTSTGASGGLWGKDSIRTNIYTTTEAGQVYSVVVYSSGVTAKFRGVMTNSDKSTLTYGSEVSGLSVINWLSLPITSANLLTSTNYRVGVWIGIADPIIRYDTSLTMYRDNIAYHATNAPPNPIVDDSSSVDRKMTMYARYNSTAAGTYTEVFDTSGTHNWIPPTGVTSATVECWGGGGGAYAIGTPAYSSYGGGGGAYAASTGVAVTAGTSYAVVVGAGGSGTNPGVASSFNTTTVVADYGRYGSQGSAGGGGTVASSTGDTKYAGGDGGSSSGNQGGGGGGAGGPDGAGVVGSNATATVGGNGGAGDNGSGGAGGAGGNGGPAGAGTASILGGGGGGGGDDSWIGANGGTYGGGGGGNGYLGSTGSNGATGACRITYTIASASPAASVGPIMLINGVSTSSIKILNGKNWADIKKFNGVVK